MKTGYLFAAFAALASATDVVLPGGQGAGLITPSPIVNMTCLIPAKVENGGFAEDGFGWTIEKTVGDLQYEWDYGGNSGVKADADNRGSFHFRVLNGSGSFGISQSICANPSKGYLLSWYAGMTAPPASHLPAGGGGSSTGCTISFMLNDAFVPTTQPFCGPHASAPFDYGLCTEPSYDILTRYAQQSSRWRSTQLSNTIGFLFNCTASPTPGSNAQANLDLVVNAETDWTNSSLAL